MKKAGIIISVLVVLALSLGLALPIAAQEPCVSICCVESVNPHGKTVPPAGWSTAPGIKYPNSGINPDGFYQICVCSTCPVVLYISYEGSDNPRLFGPFEPGIVVKFTEAPGAAPQEKMIGSTNGQAGAVYRHFILPADALVTAACATTDVILAQHICYVPPPPK